MKKSSTIYDVYSVRSEQAGDFSENQNFTFRWPFYTDPPEHVGSLGISPRVRIGPHLLLADTIPQFQKEDRLFENVLSGLLYRH